MDYDEALTYIHSLKKFGGKPSLDRIRLLLHKLGNPQDKLKFIHIAGTNGKGSTAAITAAVLRHCGYKVGLFTSPFIIDFRERIQINGQLIEKKDLAACVETLSGIVKETNFGNEEDIGEFEFITALSMYYFEKSKCDIVVLEVGLGGRYDATNVIGSALVSVVTSISLDHTAILGDRIEKIAYEKCGIFKQNGVVVTYPKQHLNAMTVITAQAKEQGCKLILPNLQELKILSECASENRFIYKGLNLDLKLIGEHQIYNCITAVEVLYLLRDKGFCISDYDIINGVQDTRFIGRFEKISEDKDIYIDGAHNLDGVKQFTHTVTKCFKDKKIILILGMVDDKDYISCIDMFCDIADTIITTKPNTPRALESTVLFDIIDAKQVNAYDMPIIEDAICKANSLYNEYSVIIGVGSLYLIGDIKKHFFNRQDNHK